MVFLLRLSRVGMDRDCGVFNVVKRATLVSFVGVDKTGIKEEPVVYIPQNQRRKKQPQYGQGNNREPTSRGQGDQNMEKKEFHPFCGR
jgi:hypothetical protein